MSLLLNVLKALAGVVTIGSPRRLNEVFISTGTPVFCAKRLDDVVVAGVPLTAHGLQPPRTHVRDGRDNRLLVLQHVADHQHETLRILPGGSL